MSLTLNSVCYLHIPAITAVTWWTVHEYIVADACRSKKRESAFFVHERQASLKWCVASRHLSACGYCKWNIYMRTQEVWATRLNAETYHSRCFHIAATPNVIV